MKISQKFLFALVLVSLTQIKMYAQSSANLGGFYNDVATFGSYQSNFGTARIMAVGGGTTVLGGDISSISGNPAGLGMYKRGDFSFTPQFTQNNTSTTYRNEESRGSSGKLNLANLGVVFSNMKDPLENGAFRGISFGFAINKLRDYNATQNFSGYANANVKVDGTNFYADRIGYVDAIRARIGDNYTYGNLPLDKNKSYSTLDFQAYQAFSNYLIDTISNSDQRLRSFLPASDLKQTGTFNVTGRSYSYDFSAGSNIDNKLFLGIGVSIISHKYNVNSTITEQFTNIQTIGPQSDPLNKQYNGAYYTLNNVYDYSGSGVNARLGLIYLPNDFLRLGLNYTTQTYNSITQNYNSTLSSSFNNAPYFGTKLASYTYSINNLPAYTYEVYTPAKLSVGLALFNKDYGYITIDADYMNFQNATVQDQTNSSLQADNAFIKQAYSSGVTNLRLGGELKLGEYAWRLGFGYYQNPYSNSYMNYSANGQRLNANTTSDLMSLSTGFGYRNNDFYLDFALVYRDYSQGFVSHLYTPVASTTLHNYNLAVTLGFPFE